MTSNQTASPIIRDAGAPFANADADIILRSNDDVDFHVHRVLLSVTSTVFADMFALPSGDTDVAAGDEVKDGVKVVKMPEDEQSLRILLGYCYLAMEPVVVSSLDDAERALIAADKYQLSRGRVLAMERLTEFAKQDPERVYALGWRLQAADVVRIGALESLAKPYTVELPKKEKVLKAHPRGDAIKHDSLVQAAASTAFNTSIGAVCENCASYQVATASAFVKLLTLQMETVLAEVPLETPF